MHLLTFLLFLLGLFTMLIAWAGRTKWGMIAGGILMLPLIASVSWELSLPEVEWNPLIHDDSSIIGMYANADESLVLKLDKGFIYHTASRQMEGTWRHDDWNLYLTSANEPASVYMKMRFIQSEKSYYILTKEPKDLDGWDGDLGLKKINQKAVE